MQIMYGYEIRKRDPEPKDELKWEAYHTDTATSYPFRSLQEACNFAHQQRQSMAVPARLPVNPEADKPDLSAIETCDDLDLMGLWMAVMDWHDCAGPRRQRAKAYWVGMGSRPEGMRAGLIAYRDATNDKAKENALLGIVNQYDADVREQANR
jgi:hypothetical protein